MKKYILLGLLFCYNQLSAQITIDMSDFASANDTVVFSELAAPFTVDPLPTDTNYAWDFSFLQFNNQRADTFLSVPSTGLTYSLFFVDAGFNPNRANLALRGSLPAVPGVSVTDVYNFYYNSVSSYLQTGYGATINGTQVPVAYGNKDVIYSFPLNYGDYDTSYSDVSLSVPGLGSLNSTQSRFNYVDGWGAVTTPYGTFACLRQLSLINGHDSIYVDSLSMGFGFDRITLREYKWLAKNMDAPVLQINTQEFTPGVESVTSVFYLDSLHVPVGIEAVEENAMVVYPNPSSGGLYIVLPSGQKSSKLSYSIQTLTGKPVITERDLSAASRYYISIADLPEGIYIVTADNGYRLFQTKILVMK